MANLPQRKSIRLKNYNYSADGFYFVTICTQNRRCLFGDIVGADPRVGPYMYMNLNEIGQMVEKWWLKIQKRFQKRKIGYISNNAKSHSWNYCNYQRVRQ